MLSSSITRNSILLGAFALATTVLIAGIHLSTRDRIAAEERAAEQRALLEIVPASRHDNSMLDDVIMTTESTPQLGLDSTRPIYRARLGGEPVAAILPARAPDGYSGAIDLLIGINVDGSVSGVRVLSHRETPGLGDKVDLKKSDWILDRKSTRLNSSHSQQSRMPSSA